MWQRFTLPARTAVLRAQEIATQSRSADVSPAHLFMALMDGATLDTPLGALLLSAGYKVEEARLYVAATIVPVPTDALVAERKLTPGAEQILRLASDEARRVADSQIGAEHLLLGCLRRQKDVSVWQTLEPLGWNLKTLRSRRREMAATSREPAANHPLAMLTEGAQRVVDDAYSAMRATFCGRISTAHLLLGLLSSDNRAVEVLEEVGISPADLKAQARTAVRSDGVLATADKRFDKGAKRALDRAKLEAQVRGAKFIGADHILLGLLPRRPTKQELRTWGRDVPDEAARLLANVEVEKFVELAGPKVPLASAPPPVATPDVPAFYAKWTFVIAFVFEFMRLLIIWNLRWGAIATVGRLAGLVFVLVLVTTGLGACGMLLFSRKQNLKTAWASAFFGAVLGTLASILIYR